MRWWGWSVRGRRLIIERMGGGRDKGKERDWGWEEKGRE